MKAKAVKESTIDGLEFGVTLSSHTHHLVDLKLSPVSVWEALVKFGNQLPEESCERLNCLLHTNVFLRN